MKSWKSKEKEANSKKIKGNKNICGEIKTQEKREKKSHNPNCKNGNVEDEKRKCDRNRKDPKISDFYEMPLKQEIR